MSAPASPATPDEEERSHAQLAVVTALVFASMFAYSVIRAPVPNVNEPHYLCKAKHYWNPDWCAGDFFLESSNPHQFFYQVVGWPTLWLSLETTTWLGRILALGLLAVGWTALVSRLRLGAWEPLWSLWLYMFLVAAGNFSGEWVIGGVESKVFAYGLVLLAGAFALEGSWNKGAVAAGLAVAFHPLVGVWSLIAALMSAILVALRGRSGVSTTRGGPWIKPALLPLLLLFVCALPGLLPALSIVGQGAPEADRVQVYERLAHHLDPMAFPVEDYIWAGVLVACWLVCRDWRAGNSRMTAFEWFVAASLLIAVVGLLVGWGPRPPEQMPFYQLRTALLKFYPFRLFDAVLPVVAAITVVGRAQSLLESTKVLRGWRQRRGWVIWAASGAALLAALMLPAVDRNPSRLKPDHLTDWIEACRWIESRTPADALFVTPQASWAFKWYAQRPEFFSYKDCPQDAEAILEWKRRHEFLREWRGSRSTRFFTRREVDELREQTGATYMVAVRWKRFPLERLFENGTFAVYRLPE